MFKKRRTVKLSVLKVGVQDGPQRRRDLVVVEEPLTILWQAGDGPLSRLTATMRTPGTDNELAAGLLFSEGLLRCPAELESLSFCVSGGPNQLNRVRARLRISTQDAERRLSHRPSGSLPQSACGMCAFDELADPKILLKWAADARPPEASIRVPSRSLLHLGLDTLANQCPTFAATGASHAVVALGPQGQVAAVAEDVGRHNACDKVLGALFLAAKPTDRPFRLPDGTGLLFSSRLSFELAAKAVRAGAAWVASVGAPTHLAIELADSCRLPAIGFLSYQRYNLYGRAQPGDGDGTVG